MMFPALWLHHAIWYDVTATPLGGVSVSALLSQLVALFACAQVAPPRTEPNVPELLAEREKTFTDLARVLESMAEMEKARQASARSNDERRKDIEVRLDRLKRQLDNEPEAAQLRAAVKACTAELAKNRAERASDEDFFNRDQVIRNRRAERLRDELRAIDRQLGAKK